VVCEETAEDRTKHAAALSNTQDAEVLLTGVPLIEELDAMCDV